MQGQSQRMGLCVVMGILLIIFVVFHTAETTGDRRVVDVDGGPESVIWVVQLSDLHFSVHHPERAIDFKNLVGPALSVINPSVVLITGDLTDGKSKDLLTMKQNENEWVEYQSVMDDVVTRSGLDKSIFYDLRGNHDNFGTVSASLDFFSNYSINAHFARKSKLNSVTIQTGERKHLFVGIDSTSSVGVRGPTNLFGHPTDELLDELDSELSQWNSVSTKPVTKISFGHFPLSFSAYTSSGKSLKEIFLKHSISAYLCGHLHSRFGKNLKRYHRSSSRSLPSQELFQLNMHQQPLASNSVNCSFEAPQVEEFWEWEMGDWRKSRAMRILGIDRGLVSYVDIDFQSGAKETIILPTFPLDSRYMSTSSLLKIYDCQLMVPSSYETVRALVFSFSPIVSVVARVYDSISGNHIVVLEAPMVKHVDKVSRADLYISPWNYRAFEDPSPDRYWLQIESTDVKGRSTLTDLKPFSLNGLSTKVSWTWKEFFVMGCQWANLYYPILWSALSFILFILIVPKFFLAFSRKLSYKDFASEKPVLKFIAWVLQDFCKIHVLWFGTLVYVLYLVLCPWFLGQVFTDGWNRGYMTYMGWVVKISGEREKLNFIGFPDIMVVVFSHLLIVVLPTIFISIALSAERGIYREGVLSLSRKKEDDHRSMTKKSLSNDLVGGRRSKFHLGDRWIRKLLLILCFAICWKHFQNCRALMKAYDMNPLLHFPVYSMAVPALLACGVYKTRSFDDNEYKHE